MTTSPSAEPTQSAQDGQSPPAAPPAAQGGSSPPEGSQGASQSPEELLREVKKLRSENQGLRRRSKEAEEAAAKAEEATQSEHEKAIAKAVRDARKEWDSEHRATLLTERVIAAAAAKVADPADAVALMDLTNLDPDDRDGISAAVDALLEEKPYLAKDAKPGASTPPPIPQGPQGHVEGGKPAQGDPNQWLREQVLKP